MKKIPRFISRLFAIAAITLGFSAPAHSQLYEIANQIPQLLQPALSGSFRYRGFVDASYTHGLGSYNADFVGVSTSQGFQYSSWFFMGVGLGIDGFFSNPDDSWGNGWSSHPSYDPYRNHLSTTSCVMLPVFTDFRFNFGKSSPVSFFADIKLGCAFLTGNRYVRINNGYITNNEFFYLKPTLGVRIATNTAKPKQGINVGLTYQLLTSDYWYGPSRTATINALGLTIGYEW